jgi:hypothetical protein
MGGNDSAPFSATCKIQAINSSDAHVVLAFNQWPDKVEVLGRVTPLSILSHVAEWVLLLARAMFIGKFPSFGSVRDIELSLRRKC